MIFGYGGAVVAGFLLTAIPNWTGRLPVAGTPLAALAALWGVGRIAVFASAPIGRTAAAVVDAGFLVVFAALVGREVVAGKNWRNLKVAGLVLALALVDVTFHVEDAREGVADFSIRAGLALVVMLILLIGGRVTPSFTGNWIARMGAGARRGRRDDAGDDDARDGRPYRPRPRRLEDHRLRLSLRRPRARRAPRHGVPAPRRPAADASRGHGLGRRLRRISARLWPHADASKRSSLTRMGAGDSHERVFRHLSPHSIVFLQGGTQAASVALLAKHETLVAQAKRASL